MPRKSLATPELIEQMLLRVAKGESIKGICREKGMPDYTTVFKWLKNNDGLKEQFLLAMQAKANLADAEIDEIRMEIRGLADKVNSEQMSRDAAFVAIQEARLQIDTLKWKAAKYYPKMFGTDTQKVDVEVKGGSFIDDLKRVAERVEARKQIEAVDAEYVESGDEGANLLTDNSTSTRDENENHSQLDVADKTE